MGTLAELWRFPVKSLRGERLEEAALDARGVPGDRGYALIDVETGEVASAKRVERFPELFACRATYVEEPEAGRPLPPVRIELPRGAVVESDDPAANRMLSDSFRREVRLARSAPTDAADPAARGDTTVGAKLGPDWSAGLGAAARVPVGAFFDAFPLSLLTTATLARLAALRPASRFDPRRFRMNLIVASDAAGFVENGWIGRELAVGRSARVAVGMPGPRCVMTTLAQEELPADADVLRALVEHNRLPVGASALPCAGVFVTVSGAGRVRVGDAVALR